METRPPRVPPPGSCDEPNEPEFLPEAFGQPIPYIEEDIEMMAFLEIMLTENARRYDWGTINLIGMLEVLKLKFHTDAHTAGTAAADAIEHTFKQMMG